MRELSEIFSDPEELGMAQKVLSVVPLDIGDYPYCWARFEGIIYKAHSKETVLMDIEETDRFNGERARYCRDHKILDRLVEAGFIKNDGAIGNDSLYVKES